MKLRLLALLLLIGLLMPLTVHAQPSLEPLLIPVGGGYQHLEAGFLPAVIERAATAVVRILVLPIAYASHPETISSSERTQNLADAQARRRQIEAACRETIPADMDCAVVLAPVFVRRDAEAIPLPQFLPADLSGVFILGGDQTIAMQVIAGTPLEAALEQAYTRGVVISGTSAGAAVQSYTMLGGYAPEFDERTSMRFGAVDIWLPPERRGLPFGVQSAILDQHFYQRGRPARLLNAIALPESPAIGVGLDAYTGARLAAGRTLSDVFGGYTVTILDAATYHAAAAAQYRGPNRVVSLRNVLVHLLPPGDFSYDLETRSHSLREPLPSVDRRLANLALPSGAGPLYLGGDLRASLAGNPIVTSFVNASGGQNANLLVIAAGYPGRPEAQRDANRYLEALDVSGQIKVITPVSPPLSVMPNGITGIVLIGRDASQLRPDLFPAVKEAWLAGAPVLADDAGASAIGSYFAAQPPTPESEAAAEPWTQGAFVLGGLPLERGAGFLNILVEPRLLGNNRWGRLFALAYNHAAYPALGLAEGTALVITPDGAQVWGENAVFVLDLSLASLGTGANRAFAVANGFLDVFAPGELVQFTRADQSLAPVRAATPVLPTAVPSPEAPPAIEAATAEPSPVPTLVESTPAPGRTPPPTPTRMILPSEIAPSPSEPTDRNLLHSMIGLGVAAVVTIVIGVWINRGRFNLR